MHTLAEVYAAMTVLPVKPMIPPEQAVLFVEEVRKRLTLVSLNEDEYCAAKVKAQTIYTWNLKHFQAVAPELAARMRTP